MSVEAVINDLAQRLAEYKKQRQAVRISGSDSKAFYGNRSIGKPLSARMLTGIVAHEPSELYITANAGEPLAAVDKLLAERGQMLPFEPPRYNNAGTVGGAVACGLAGPGKPRYGGVRDSILGIRLINGSGEVLNFGGQVMKNVAGYDISRLNVGALGGLGIIAEATFKVSPRPLAVHTTILELTAEEAVSAIGGYLRRSMPVSATFYDGRRLYIRLSSVNDVGRARRTIGGDSGDGNLWEALRDHRHAFFLDTDSPLWRFSVPAGGRTAAAFAEDLTAGRAVFEWNGGIYWRRGGTATAMHERARILGGFACLFRRARAQNDNTPFLQPPPPPLMRLHRRLKESFDPAAILNPGRLYPGC